MQKKWKLRSICTGNHVGDCSWCCQDDDDSSWAVSLIDVVLLVQDANTLPVKREMRTTPRIYKLCTTCKLCKLCTICKLYISIDPQVSKLLILFFLVIKALTCWGAQTPQPVPGPVEGLKYAKKNTKNAAYATCGSVSIIELRAHIEHRVHSLYCYEPCRASDWSTAMEILDRRVAIDSLCCSDEPDGSALQGLCQSWSYHRLVCVRAAEFHWK